MAVIPMHKKSGSQGKHVLGHNNYSSQKSSWSKGEDGVKVTQEAWMKGEYIDPAKTKKVYKHPQYGEIRVHINSKGEIHGYPTGK